MNLKDLQKTIRKNAQDKGRKISEEEIKKLLLEIKSRKLLEGEDGGLLIRPWFFGKNSEKITIMHKSDVLFESKSLI